MLVKCHKIPDDSAIGSKCCASKPYTTETFLFSGRSHCSLCAPYAAEK